MFRCEGAILVSLFERISFHAYLRAKRPEHVDRYLQAFERRIGAKVTVEKSERYWKDKSLFSVMFSIRLDESDVAQTVFRTLAFAGSLVPEWSVRAPEKFDGERWEFSGMGTNK